MIHYLGAEKCSCGKVHTAPIDEVLIGSGVLARLPEIIRKYGASRPFVLADVNTYAAAGQRVCKLLEENGIAFEKYVFPTTSLKPDERTVGSAVMHFPASCDLIIAVGSGVLNDTGKILSCLTKSHYIIVATAPSMDGYASSTSSMDVDGRKVSLPSRCADVIVGDLDVLKNAPMAMLRSGIGDMLAKYVSIAEWRIGNIITGEYYCERVAQLIRGAVQKCVENAEGLQKRDETAVRAVFEGLVIGGVAMTYAGVSRPASGVEHYFSHIWDMRGLEFGTKTELHGIQCAMGTLLAAKLYDCLKTLTPDADAAKSAAARFDREAWNAELRAFLGKAADSMIALEEKEKKYDKAAHEVRLRVICENWDEILQIVSEELPDYPQMQKIVRRAGIDCTPSCIGVDSACLQMTFRATKDIRDKYVLSRLAWDLGILDRLCEECTE